MAMKHTHLFAILLALLSGLQARADLLVLEGQESLSGRLVRVREGSAVFRTTLQGQMMAPMEHVEALSTEGDYVVTFQDESVQYGRFVIEEGKTLLQPIAGGDAGLLNLKTVLEATLLPRSQGGEGDQGATTLSAQLGAQVRSGKSSAVEPVVGLSMGNRSGQNQLQGDLSVERADAEAFPAWLRGQLEWRSGGGAWGPFAHLNVLRDRDNALNVRGEASLGLGRVLASWNGGDENSLYALAGVNLSYEDWQSAISGGEKSETEAGLRLGLRYARSISGGSELSSSLDVVPSLTDFGAFRAGAGAALLLPMSDRLYLRLHLLIEYDEERALREVDRWNSSVGASVRFGF